MENTKKRLKPYHGIILIILAAIDIFWLGRILGARLGLYGTMLSELILLLLAVGTAAVFRGDLKRVFPVRRPEAAKVFGTLVLWLGSFLGTMLITMLVAFFFPRQMMGASAGLSSTITSVPFLISFFIVSIMPAVCEEAVFRGTFLNSLRGTIHNKWIIILIVSTLFGVFHGSIWRFIPTAMLGVALTYLIIETDNMFYNMLFHAVNNAVPIILMYLLQIIYGRLGLNSMLDQTSAIDSFPLMSLASYMMYGGGALFLIYIGNYLLHKGQPGYDRGLFPREKNHVLITLVAIGLTMMLIGVGITAIVIIRTGTGYN